MVWRFETCYPGEERLWKRGHPYLWGHGLFNQDSSASQPRLRGGDSPTPNGDQTASGIAANVAVGGFCRDWRRPE